MESCTDAPAIDQEETPVSKYHLKQVAKSLGTYEPPPQPQRPKRRHTLPQELLIDFKIGIVMRNLSCDAAAAEKHYRIQEKKRLLGLLTQTL